MTRRTRGNILLNAYANRYVNEQASNVNRGQSNIASAKTQGAQQISAVPTDLPELTDYSGQVYDSILQHEKDRQAAYKKAVEEAQKAAEAAQKAAARSARSSSRRSSGGGSGKSSGGSSDEAAVLPGTDTETVAAEETTSKAKKGAALKKNAGKKEGIVSRVVNGAKGLAAKATSLADSRVTEEQRENAEETTRQYRMGNIAESEYQNRAERGTKAASSIDELTEQYRRGQISESEYQNQAERLSRQETRRQEQQQEQEDEAKRQTTLQNLLSDSTYLHNLAQPGVTLSDAEIDAVREYLDQINEDGKAQRRIIEQSSRGLIDSDEALQLTADLDNLEQKVSFGGLGQHLQAFTAGLYNSVPFAGAAENSLDELTDGDYSAMWEQFGGTPTQILEDTEQQNEIAGMAGRFAGNAAMYGAANTLLEGTAAANAANAAGQRAAGALSRVPGLNRFSTQGMGNAIGNIITGQSVDLALDTIPNLANDISEGATAQEAAANAAQNFGVNLAMNVGSEAIPALWNAGRNAVTNAAENARAARGVQEAVDTGNARALVDAYENARLPDSSVLDADAAAEGVLSYSNRPFDLDISQAGEAPAGAYSAVSPGNVTGDVYTVPRDVDAIRRTAQNITGTGRQSQTTRQVEDFLGEVSDGLTAPDTLRSEAEELASRVYRPEMFTTRVDDDPANRALRDYLRNTQIRVGDQEAGDLLYSSGAKNLSDYNRQNATRFSRTAGVDWDSAMQELSGMDVGVRGDTFNDLLDAVERSRTRPESVTDEDLYNSVRDWTRERLLTGSDGSFDDYLEGESFNPEAPDYLLRVYDRSLNGDLVLPDSMNNTASISAPSDLPENAVGAKRQEYAVGDVVPNRDYAAQAAARQGLDEEHAAAVPTFEHRVWTDREAQRQALEDINTAVQSNGGDFDAGVEMVVQDLRDTKDWDKGNIATAQEVRNRLRTQFQQTTPKTPEFYRQRARYKELLGMESGQLSKSAQTLQAGSMDAGARVDVAARRVREQWAKTHGAQDKRITELQDELDRLRKELNTIKQADVDAVTGAGDAIPKAKPSAGDMDREFGEFLETQGINTDPTEQFNDLVTQIKKMCSDKGVKISDEAAKEIAGAIQNGASKETYYNTLLNEAAGITDLSMDELAIVDDLYSKAATLPDSKERYDLEQQALQIMARHLPAKSWFERFDNIRYLAMLGNTRTHARNLIGNVMMSTVSKAKDEVSAAMQLFIPQNQRTRALYTPREMKQAARDYLNENAYSALRQGGRYNLAQGLERVRSTYGNSPIGRGLQRLSDLNSKALEKEDEIFLQSAFVRSLASNLTAKGYDTSIFSATDEVSRGVLDNAVQQAITDAKDATFRADNALTEMLGKIGNLGDKKGSIGQKVGYMITNGLLPFTKTPANILKTSLEYTPVGGIVEAAYRGATGKGSAAVADALAKGTVGTGLMGVGWYLADAGLVTAGQDEDTEGYNETLGTQNYSVRIPGVGSYTIDWASPSAVPFLTGAALAEDGVDLGSVLNDPGKLAGQFGDIMRKALDPVTEMSLLSGVNDFLDHRYGENNSVLGLASDLVTSYVQQFVPTVFGQVARSIDPLRRSTYGGGDTSSERNMNYLLQSTLNKIPGVSQDAEPYIDQWGRTEASLDNIGDYEPGVLGRLAYNMLSPGYFSAENVTPVDEYVQGLYGATGDAGVIPQKAGNYVTVDNEKRYFTPEEKTEYAATRGQLSYDLLDELSNNAVFNSLSESQQAGIVKDVYSLSNKVGANAAIPSLDYSDDDAYSVYQSSGEQGVIDMLLSSAAFDSALADKKSESGNDSARLTDYEKWNAVSGLGLDDESAVDTYLAQLPANSSVGGKAQQIESQYGANVTADFLTYMYNYDYAYDRAKENAAGTDEKVSQQWIAQSVLDQLGYSDDLKRLFWQMTNTNWSESNNPY